MKAARAAIEQGGAAPVDGVLQPAVGHVELGGDDGDGQRPERQR